MKLTTGLATAALACGAGLAAPAGAEQLTVAHGYVPAHTVYKNAIEPWLACVEEKSDGGITFDHYPSGQISGHKESMTSLVNGLADVSAVVPGYESGKLPLTNMSMLPGFGATASDMNTSYRAMLDNDSAIVDEWSEQGVQPIMPVFTPAYQILSMDDPWTTIDALKGKKIRAGGGTAVLAVASVGAVPVEMASPDMFVALQRGTMDATILSLTSAPAYGLPDILKSASTNGSFGSGMAVWAMSKEKYDSLAPELQAAIDDCGREIEVSMGAAVDSENEQLKEQFAAKGITTYEFPPDVLEQINENLATVGEDYVTKLEERGVDKARETYETYRGVLK